MSKPMYLFNPFNQFFDNSGLALNGGKLFIYQPQTTTKQNTYPTSADAIAGTNPNPNPIILNSAGRPANNGAPIDIYCTGAVKLVLAPSTDTDPPANAIATEDNITTLGQLVSIITKTTNYTVTAADRDKYIEVDASAGSVTITLIPAATAGNGFNLKIKKIDSTINSVIIQANASENIDGSNTYTTTTQNAYLELYSDGTQWFTTHSPAAFQVVHQIFTSSGTYTPTAKMLYCIAEGVGGGGGSGGNALTSTSQSAAGGSGAGGTYSRVRLTATQIGTNQTVTIGAGGVAGTAGNNNGGGGGTTSLGSLLTAPGGGGGGGSPVGTTTLTYLNSGGSAGATGTGDVSIPGQPGTAGMTGAVGGNCFATPGGASLLGFGGLSPTGVGATVGGNYGGGASGPNSQASASAVAGATGAQGILIITEFVSV